MLTSVKFNGSNLKAHLTTFDVLVNQVVQSGHTVHDTSKYLYLTDSIESGNNRSYDDIITISRQMNPPETYSVLLNKLTKRYDILNLKTLISQAKQYNNNDNQNNNRNINNNRNNVSITCAHCNQPGHPESRCWSKVPCFNCGVIAAGHNPHFCAQNQSTNNVSGNTSDDNGTKVELLGNFKKKWGSKK